MVKDDGFDVAEARREGVASANIEEQNVSNTNTCLLGAFWSLFNRKSGVGRPTTPLGLPSYFCQEF
jgi:hypothetical protein